ncbi:phosphorylase family protein [Hyalangium gracile]|uniref:phosphorylase family protein n=1 Tax=Hyalangium gracile TaxID=394092 RepID=UPI001CCED97F|nr:5'-methylthioadenosine/S-adenosylhomocysteine nucleosidase [Hyalangium gracile]
MDIAIITVIQPELFAVLDALSIPHGAREKSSGGTAYFGGLLHSQVAHRDYRLVVTCTGFAGNSEAAAATQEVITRYKPRLVLLMGIAAGIRGKVKIGEVILSERVIAYEHAALVASQDGGASRVEHRPEIDRVSHSLHQDIIAYNPDPARLEVGFRRIQGEYPMATSGKEQALQADVASAIILRTATVASGEKLLRDPARLVAVRQEQHGKVEVGEMEAAGLVDACRRNNTPWLVIRGISDFGDALKNDSFHEFASRAAATVLADFLAHGLDLRGPAWDATEGEPARPILPKREMQETKPLGEAGPVVLGKSLAEWIDVVRSGDPSDRRQALGILADQGPRAESVLPDLLELLKEPHHTSQVLEAIQAIGPRNQALLLPLVRLLGHADHEVSGTTTSLLAGLGADAVAPLCRALDDKSRRNAAAEALQKIGAPALPRLLLLTDDERDAVRDTARRCLDTLAPSNVAELIRLGKQDPTSASRVLDIFDRSSVVNEDVSSWALEVLRSAPPRKLAALAASVAVRTPAPAASCLPAAEIALWDEREDVRDQATKVLQLTGRDAIPTLRTLLPRVDAAHMRHLLPALNFLAADSGPLGQEIHDACHRLQTDDEMELELTAFILDFLPEWACTREAHAPFLDVRLSQLRAAAMERLLQLGPHGLRSLLGSLHAVPRDLRPRVVTALLAAQDKAADVLSAGGGMAPLTHEALAFYATTPPYALAALPSLVRRLVDLSSRDEESEEETRRIPLIVQVLDQHPEATRREFVALTTRLKFREKDIAKAASRLSQYESILDGIASLLESTEVHPMLAGNVLRAAGEASGPALQRLYDRSQAGAVRQRVALLQEELGLTLQGRLKLAVACATGVISGTIGSPLGFLIGCWSLTWRFVPNVLVGIWGMVATIASPSVLSLCLVGTLLGASAALASAQGMKTMSSLLSCARPGSRARSIMGAIAGALSSILALWLAGQFLKLPLIPSEFVLPVFVTAGVAAIYAKVDWKD